MIPCSEKYLFSGSVDHSIKTWDMESCEVVSTIPAHENPVCTLTINGSRLYSGSLKSIKVKLNLCPLRMEQKALVHVAWFLLGKVCTWYPSPCVCLCVLIQCRCGILRQRTSCGGYQHRTTGSEHLSLQRSISTQAPTRQSRWGHYLPYSSWTYLLH